MMQTTTVFGGYLKKKKAKKHDDKKSKSRSQRIEGGRTTMRKKPTFKEPIASSLTTMFLSMLNTVKLYHWKTNSYAQHVATDGLYLKLNKHIDKFMEVFLGKEEGRLQKLDKKINLSHPKTLEEMKTHLYQYRDYLIDMNKVLDSEKDTDLLNVRDEILADINQVLYLFTFK